MYYILKGHDYYYDVQTMAQVFLPGEKFIRVEEVANKMITIKSAVGCTFCCTQIYEDGRLLSIKNLQLKDQSEKEIRKKIKLTIFFAFKDITDLLTPWGILTGIRPSKIVNELLSTGLTVEEIKIHMEDYYLCDEDKIDLSIKVAKEEQKIISKNNGEDVSLYIGIPFCPTTCLYCSFASFPIKKYEKYVDAYMAALAKEMEFIRKHIDSRSLESVYIGGGTPTSLNDQQFETLLKMVKDNINIGQAVEYTVEAGRPDTINSEKLKLMKKYSVTRISINPQTLNNDTLRKIGREHSKEDFIAAFRLARSCGFDNINVDIILGLPDETVLDVENTLLEILALQPDSITVHTLAVKQGSRLKETIDEYSFAKINEIEEMLKVTHRYTRENGFYPYYMYRQKNMLGSFENVGYCKEAKESIYNVQIMEEKQSIFAIGAAGVTKIYEPKENKIDRIFNVKSVMDYIQRIDEMIKRKEDKL